MTVGFIHVQELHDKISSGEPVFILDVRTPEAYQNWQIKGGNLQSVNIFYSDFSERGETVDYGLLPTDQEIIVVCNRGVSAKIAADVLDEKGYRIRVLQEGMLAWSQFYHPVTVAEEADMSLIQINRLGKGCLSYMVISQGQAMVVDPGRHIGEYLKLAEQKQARIRYCMDTHLHADHISGGQELAKQADATYYISKQEMQHSPLPYAELKDTQTIRFGSVQIRVLAIPTPGHTPGSVSFLVNDRYLLSGDTIFVSGLGRPDLGGKAREWAQLLYDTVFTTLAGLPDDILVLPTHFADQHEINSDGFVGATLGEIRRNNDVMRTVNRDLFTEMVAGVSGATPPNYAEIVDINRGILQVDTLRATDLEIGPNRCAAKHTSP